MSTRAQVRFATREDGVSFSEHPDKITAQFYVHHDGYPEGLGIDIAHSILGGCGIDQMEIEELQDVHTDLDYIYYVWQDYDKDSWISIFDVCWEAEDQCVFVGKPESLISKYKLNTNEDG